jgi:hypothetical protein
MSWAPFVGSLRGSESGIVEIDEEHDCGARITLERDAKIAPYAITCGIYGWMVHTRYFEDHDRARREYEAMKAGLGNILSIIPLRCDPDFNSKVDSVIKAIGDFVESFPT